jgi:hypothetical protein
MIMAGSFPRIDSAGIRRVRLRATRRARKSEQNYRSADAVISAMRDRGCTLRVTQQGGAKPYWALSNGAQVPPEVAQIVISDLRVIGLGDTLLGDVRFSQTFRFAG